MVSRGRVGLSVVALLAAALGLSACLGAPPPPPPPPPAPPPGPATSCGPAPLLQAPAAPIPPAEAGEEARAAVAESDVRTETGAVPLVVVEETPAGSEITMTPVATADEAAVVAEQAAADGDLVAVEVDTPVYATDHPPSNDTDRPKQWALNNVKFEHAAAHATGGSGQVVAVIDTGVQRGHPDFLSGQVLPGQSFLHDPQGNPITGTPGDTDEYGHGTHVAGIIGAVANNGTGITGAAPNVQILPVKVLGSDGKGWASDVTKGIEWAASQPGVTVINLSLGSGSPPSEQLSKIQAARAKGVVVVAAAGNDGECGPASYPAAFSEVIAVGATTSANTRAGFSTIGSYLDLAAPGDAIYSTYKNSDYTTLSGTSMATPHVTAAAALVRAKHPEYTTHQQVCDQLIRSAQPLGAPGVDSEYGHGLIRPDVAVGATALSGPSCA